MGKVLAKNLFWTEKSLPWPFKIYFGDGPSVQLLSFLFSSCAQCQVSISHYDILVTPVKHRSDFNLHCSTTTGEKSTEKVYIIRRAMPWSVLTVVSLCDPLDQGCPNYGLRGNCVPLLIVPYQSKKI